MSDDTSAVLSFEQHHLPGLESGEYLVTVEQTLEMQEAQAGSGEKQKKTVTPVAKAFFTIAGNRFRPLGAELVQVYPPDKAVGEYERTFAHVVLANPSFPWTREPVTPPLKAPGPADNDHDADVAAWLAVLLLDEDDGVALQPAAKQVNDLFE
ncbi:MAG: hypothetical protein JWM74_1350, partial [Myxococcaceae bacterium]|nr:hypothetical protein [Myxococcaceae bacterium]